MRPHRRLKNLERSASKRLKRLHKLAFNVSLQPPCKDREVNIAFVVIETLNCWNNFSRSYYLSSILNPKTKQGKRIATSVAGYTYNQAIHDAILLWKPRSPVPTAGIWHRRSEPPWFDPNILMNSCQQLNCSNIVDIQAALSLGSRVFLDLPTVRNFYGHRNPQTELAASNIGLNYLLPTNLHPTEMLLSRPPTRPQPLILDWIDDIITTITSVRVKK